MGIEKITADITQSRYLTRPELNRLMDYFAPDSPELAYILEGDHAPAPASGACFEVLLTDEEAERVDNACELLGIGY